MGELFRGIFEGTSAGVSLEPTCSFASRCRLRRTNHVTAAALTRRESRGGHYRSDYPDTDPAGTRSFMTLSDAEGVAGGETRPLALAAIR